MSEQIEITDSRGRKSVVPVAGDLCLLGSGPDVDLRIEAGKLEARHLRFVRTGQTMRVEPVRPGTTIAVNGEELFCKDLDPGDVIEVGGLRLRWLADRPAAVVKPLVAPRPTRSHDRRVSKGESRRTARPRGMPTWILVSTLFATLLLIAVVTLRVFARSTWPSSPQHYVDLAREQLANNQPQRALDTLAFALPEAVGATREEALRLEAEIRRMLLENAELPKVLTARQEHDLILGFVGRYLRDRIERPAARELVRLCDQWLAAHREVCARNTDGQPLLAAIEEQRSRHVALAAMGEPDTAADVVFAARSLLRFQWRDYRGAMQKLDAFLRANADAKGVRNERDKILGEGEEWLRGRLRTVDMLIERGDRDNAEKDLAQIEKWSMVPEWEGVVKERRQRLIQGR